MIAWGSRKPVPSNRRLFCSSFCFYWGNMPITWVFSYSVHLSSIYFAGVQTYWSINDWYHILNQHTWIQGEKPVCFSTFLSMWLTTVKIWRWLYAVNGVASLWCNFSSCSWQLLVESKSEASWFRYHSGEGATGYCEAGTRLWQHESLPPKSVRWVSSDTLPAPFPV